MYGMFAQKMAAVEKRPFVEVRLYTKVNHCKTECNNTMVVLVQQAQYSKLPPSLAQFSPADPDIIVYTGYGMQKVVQFYSLSQKKVRQLRWTDSVLIPRLPYGRLFYVLVIFSSGK